MQSTSKTTYPDGRQDIWSFSLTATRFEGHRVAGPQMHRCLVGVPTAVDSGPGPWTFTAYENGKAVATVFGKEPEWTTTQGHGFEDALSRLQSRQDRGQRSTTDDYGLAAAAISDERPASAWVALNGACDLTSTEPVLWEHPLSAALEKKRSSGSRALTKKNNPEETKGWVDLCVAFGARLDHTTISYHNRSPSSYSIGEWGLLLGPAASKTLCVESGVDLSALLSKRLAKYDYRDVDGPALLRWALASGDDRWLEQVKSCSELWSRDKANHFSPIEVACRDGLIKGDWVSVVAAHSLGHPDFNAAKVFKSGAAEWIGNHRFDPIRLKKGADALNKGLAQLASCETALGLDGALVEAWCLGTLQWSKATMQAGEKFDSTFRIKHIDPGLLLGLIDKINTEIPTDSPFYDLGSFEVGITLATGVSATMLSKSLDGWNLEGRRAVELAMERERAMALSMELRSDLTQGKPAKSIRTAL